MSTGLVFQHIGYTGKEGGGIAQFSDVGVTWTDRNSTAIEKIDKDSILRMTWCVYGPKAHIVVYLTDGSYYRMDGFDADKFGQIAQYLQSSLGINLEKAVVSKIILNDIFSIDAYGYILKHLMLIKL